MLWSDKYAPKKLEDIIAHHELCKTISAWASAWSKGQKQKPLLLAGAVGSGKTSIATTVANEFDFELLEMNASDVRNEKNVERIAGLASVSRTFSGKMRLILLDEIDGLFGREDSGGAGAVSRMLDAAGCPVILTANDLWDKKLASIKQRCDTLSLRTITYLSINALLKKIAKHENIEASPDALESIAKRCKGDVRAAITDFQQVAQGKSKITADDLVFLAERDKRENIFDAVRTVFKTLDFQTSRSAVSNIDEDPDFFMKWIDENIPKEYKEPNDVYEAYERLSRADIFLGRIHANQHYGFTKYAYDLMSAGVSLSKSKKYDGFTRYAFPSMLRMLSSSKAERGILGGIGAKIGKTCHTSISTAVRDYVPLLRQYAQNNDKCFAKEFNLTEEEIEYLKTGK